jgi:phosphoacetylglucosamine mutase
MASPAVKKAITEAALQYTKPEGKVFEYGTAGVSRIGEYSTQMNS